MAYYNPQEDEQEGGESQAQGGMQIGPQTATISSGGGATTSAPTANPSQNSPDKGSNFVNLNTYLNANKPQAEKLGGQVSGVIDNSANQAREGVNALNQEAQQKVQGTQSLGQDIMGKIKTGAEALTADERTLAKNTAGAQYKGPQDATQLNGYQKAADATQKATQNVEQADTEQGRMALLGQVNDKRRTSGMNTFDNALLQAGGGREKLIQSAQANQDVKSGLQNSQNAINAQIGRADDPNTPDVDESAGAIGQTNKAQQDAYKTIQDSLSAWKQGFDPKVKQAQDALVAQQNAVTQDLGDNQLGLDQQTMDMLGLNAGSRVFGLDLKSYLNPASVGEINAANVASAEDYARYNALADLAGERDLMLDPANASMAGTAPTFTAQKDRLAQDLAAAQAGYNSAYGSTKLNQLPIENIYGWQTATYRPGDDPWQTLADVESKLLPKLQGGNDYDRTIARMYQATLDKWKSQQGYNNVIKKNG